MLDWWPAWSITSTLPVVPAWYRCAPALRSASASRQRGARRFYALQPIIATIARMHSKRFSRPVIVTRHAAQRMADRGVSDVLLLQIIDDDGIRYRDDAHLWAWLDVPGRDDNLVCAVLVLEDAVIAKTVMHRWELMP